MHEVIIADLQSRFIGHYIYLAKQYSEILSDSYDVMVAGGPMYSSAFSEEKLILLPYDRCEDTPNLECLRRIIVNAHFLFKQVAGKTVIIQYGKPFSNHIAILLAYRSCNLFLIEYSAAGIDKWYKRLIYNLFKRKVKGVICPNDAVGNVFGRPYVVLPDYIYCKSENVIQRRPYEQREIDFCMVGRISPEKGVLEAAKRLAGTEFKVIIAGMPETEELGNELKRICSVVSNIDLRLRYVSSEEYVCIIESSKYALLNYSEAYSERSSGVVFDYLFHDVPVVGRECGALSVVEESESGVLYRDINTFDFTPLFEKKIHDSFVENIYCYKKKNNEYIYKLTDFLEMISR